MFETVKEEVWVKCAHLCGFGEGDTTLTMLLAHSMPLDSSNGLSPWLYTHQECTATSQVNELLLIGNSRRHPHPFLCHIHIAVRGADIVLSEPGLTNVHAICQSCTIFQHMHNYCIYTCAVTITICIFVCPAILTFAYGIDYPPFMILVIALLKDGAIMALC